MPHFIDKSGAIEAQWSDFPEAASKTAFEFQNVKLGFDTTKMGLRCDGYRRSLPDPAKYRVWVREYFDGVPSAAGGKYSESLLANGFPRSFLTDRRWITAPAAAGLRAGVRFPIAFPTVSRLSCD